MPAVDPQPDPQPSSGRPSALLAAIAIACAVLVIAAYSNSLDNSFHFDDAHVIENNLYIRSLGNASRFFTDASTFSSLPSNASYRPLLSLSLAVDYAIGGGLAPRQFHLTQIALLILLGALVAWFYERLLRRLDRPPAPAVAAIVAAALFCLHTANTETLNFISSRSEELAVIGVIGAFLLFLGFPRLRKTGLHLLPMIVGALAKVHAVMYAPLLFAYVWLWAPPERTIVQRTVDALKATWLSFAVAAATYLFIRRMDGPQWSAGATDWVAYAWTQPFVWLHYARLFVLPMGLTADTDWTLLPHWYDTRAIAGLLFIVCLIAIFVRTWRAPATRPIAFGIAWFAIALLPTSSIVPFSEVANEHRVFFPYIGLTLAAVWSVMLAVRSGAGRLSPARMRVVAAIAAVIVLLAHGAGTWARNRDWRTEETLWLDVTRKSPQNGRGLMNYGLTRMAQGDLETARQYFERAAMVTPNYGTLEINLGVVYGALGQHTVAESHFTRALALSPGASEPHFYYARWLAERGRGPEAITHLRQAYAISPGNIATRELLLRLAAAADHAEDVAALARDTLTLDPNNASAAAYARGASPLAARATTTAAAMTAGLASLSAGRLDEAAEYFRHMTLLDPRSADAWNNRGWAQMQLGFRDAAATSFERVLALNPSYDRARNNLLLARTPR